MNFMQTPHFFLITKAANNIPRITNVKPIIILKKTFIIACEISFPFNKLIVSRPNDEKVVNPPRKPVIKISLISLETIISSNVVKRNPITKQPIIFTRKVPKGNKVLE